MADHERSRTKRRPVALGTLLMVAILSLAATRRSFTCAALTLPSGQTTVTSPGPASRQTGNGGSQLGTGLDVIESPFPDTTRQKRNDERQRRIVSDTQRLVALANQLKAEIAASGAESMTPEMVRQMEEIEKLAKSVKDKMRD